MAAGWRRRRVPPTTRTAAPAPTPLQDGVAALKSGMAAQMVEMIDNGVFTDDVTALAAYQEPGDFVWGRGLAPRHHGVVNAAIGEGGQLVCLTTNTDEAVVVATLLIVEPGRELRIGRGPIGSCTTAGVQQLPVVPGDG